MASALSLFIFRVIISLRLMGSLYLYQRLWHRLVDDDSEPLMSDDGNTSIIHVRNLHAGYGDTEILHGIDLEISTGNWDAYWGRTVREKQRP